MSRAVCIEPENGRYRADLVFLHGLWTTSDIWQPAALGLAHRGWRCHLLDMRAGEGANASAFEQWCQSTADFIAGFETPPVLIGHDAGALVALVLAERSLPRAVVADAPLLVGPPQLQPRLANRIARWRNAKLPPPAATAPMIQTGSEAGRARVLNALTAEGARLVGSLTGRATRPGRPAVPTLILASPDDPAVPEHLVAITAQGIEAEYQKRSGGHYGMLEEPYDLWSSAVQRWLVRRAGPDLLVLRGDEDLDPDALI
jgi:pimeloyl-ACP methyl ester carboxylesterase